MSALRMVETRQNSAPVWHPFWHVVGALDAQEGLCPEVERLGRSAGYYGAMTAGPPPSSLKTALEQMVAAGPAQPGTGLTRIGQQAADLPPASGGPRWQSQLRPDLRRAAPDIYLNFRAEGVRNTREWVSREFAQMQNTDSYTERGRQVKSTCRRQRLGDSVATTGFEGPRVAHRR